MNTINAMKRALDALTIADNFCGGLTADVCPDTVHIPIREALSELESIVGTVVVVSRDENPDAMNLLHGEDYGVDWVYEAIAREEAHTVEPVAVPTAIINGIQSYGDARADGNIQRGSDILGMVISLIRSEINYTTPPPSAKPLPQWIPVSEKLPEYDTPVWVAWDGSNAQKTANVRYSTCEVTFDSDGWLWADEEGELCDWFPDERPTHWMPLPEAPAHGIAQETKNG